MPFCFMSSQESSAVAFFRGRWIPASELRLGYWDTGVVLGAAVAEQLRTFGHRLLQVQEHLQRLQRSLTHLGQEDSVGDQCPLVLRRLVEHNLQGLSAWEDLGVVVFITPGPYPTFAAQGEPWMESGPTVAAHTYRLPLHRWARGFFQGVELVVAPWRQVPPQCWPPEIKARSRLHFFLAQSWARQKQGQVWPLLLTLSGHVAECPTANVVVVQQDRLLTPPRSWVLPGISLATVERLAPEAGLRLEEAPLRPENLHQAQEILLTSTPFCLMPVVRFEGKAVGSGRPGPVFEKLVELWSQQVGWDLKEQMRRALQQVEKASG